MEKTPQQDSLFKENSAQGYFCQMIPFLCFILLPVKKLLLSAKLLSHGQDSLGSCTFDRALIHLADAVKRTSICFYDV